MTLQAFLAGKPVITARTPAASSSSSRTASPASSPMAHPSRSARPPTVSPRTRSSPSGWARKGEPGFRDGPGRRSSPRSGAMMAADPRLGLLLGVTPPRRTGHAVLELAHWVPVGDGRDGDYDVFLWRQVIPPIRAHGRTSCGPTTVGRSRHTATGRCSSSPRSPPWNSSPLVAPARPSRPPRPTPDARPGRLHHSCEHGSRGPRPA